MAKRKLRGLCDSQLQRTGQYLNTYLKLTDIRLTRQSDGVRPPVGLHPVNIARPNPLKLSCFAPYNSKASCRTQHYIAQTVNEFKAQNQYLHGTYFRK